MKLRNKKTGEIIESNILYISKYETLAELNEEWEDYKEDKRYWYIDVDGEVMSKEFAWFNQAQDDIGNRFETKEEAEQAVEKLKAVKRLKDKRFRFHEWYKPDGCDPFIVIETNIGLDDVDNMKIQKDLDLLFGGEQ